MNPLARELLILVGIITAMLFVAAIIARVASPYMPW